MKTLLTLSMLAYSIACMAQSAWTTWRKTPCYKQIEYRYRHVRTHGQREVFEIQFKNKYKHTVFFEYALAGEKQDEDMHHALRTSIPANKESKPTSLFANSDDFTIEVGRLSFSAYDTEYEACDNNEDENTG